MRAINVNDKINISCLHGSLIDHWLKFSGEPLPYICPETSCINRPYTIGIIQLDGGRDKNIYLIPLCQNCCERHGEVLTICNQTKLVPVSLCAADEANLVNNSFA